jgi:hypothetical protein
MDSLHSRAGMGTANGVVMTGVEAVTQQDKTLDYQSKPIHNQHK